MQIDLTRLPKTWRSFPRLGMSPRVGVAVRLLIVVGLAWFFVAGATEHARVVNTTKARGDQSGYLWDAEQVYANWHGRQPPALIGQRNRMPIYAGYLALFYRPRLSDPEFWEVAKQANIYLSLALLIVLGGLFARELPRLPAANLTGIVAFGYFIFKAGYSQADLLFYLLLFLTFLGCWHLLQTPPQGRTLWLGAVTGACAGLAHLTKAAMLPFVAVFLATCIASGAISGGPVTSGSSRRQRTLWTLASAAVFAFAFLVVLAPYLMTSKRVFGHYFYNVNSTFYVWYDDWPHASVGTHSHGDGVGWPTLPESEIPGPARYWREHTVQQIGARFLAGFTDMAWTSYHRYGYLPYLLLYAAMLTLLVATRWRDLARVLRPRAWLAVFLAAYASVYLLAIAFYYPTSGTGTGRFLLAHLAPLFFAVSCLFAAEPIRSIRWSAEGDSFGLRHFNQLVTFVLVMDVTFLVWPRLMTAYGGF